MKPSFGHRKITRKRPRKNIAEPRSFSGLKKRFFVRSNPRMSDTPERKSSCDVLQGAQSPCRGFGVSGFMGRREGGAGREKAPVTGEIERTRTSGKTTHKNTR